MDVLQLLNSSRFTLLSFVDLVRDEEDSIVAAYDLQLIPPEENCGLDVDFGSRRRLETLS